MDDDVLWNVARHRSKRFLYVANKTCGHISFCSENLHDPSIVYSTALINHPDCSKFLILTSIVVDILLCLVITTSNTLIIFIIRRSKTLYNCHGVFKINLAVFDLIMGAVVIPGCTYNKIRLLLFPLKDSYVNVLFQYDDDIVNKIFGVALTISLSGSLMSLFLLSLDRCLAVTHPFSYSEGKCMTMCRAYSLAMVVWCVVLFLAVVPFADPTNFHYTVDYMTLAFSLEIRFNWKLGNIYHGLFFLFIVFIVPYISVVAVTVATWVIVLRDNRRTKEVTSTRSPDDSANLDTKENPSKDLLTVPSKVGVELVELSQTPRVSISSASHSQGSPRRMRQISKSVTSISLAVKSKLMGSKPIDQTMLRVTLTITIIILVFTICVLPFIIVQTDNLSVTAIEFANVEKYSEGNTSTPHTCYPVLYIVFLYMIFVNSFCNFVVYNLRNATFREEFIRFFRCNRKKAVSSPCNIPSITRGETASELLRSPRASTVSALATSQV